jgi:hypothetical protein
MNPWDEYKKWFNAWEDATARYLAEWLKSPTVLEPAGAWLSAAMRAKAAGDQAAATVWGALGLPTKRDQERLLHLVQRLESRIIDLEEKLEEARTGRVSQ